MEKNNIQKRTLNGLVVSDKMDKTVVVAVDSYKTYSKYLKKFRFTKKYKVHDEENKCKIGDKVEFKQCKPFSKDKKFVIIKKI
jgi:small subunit ribosomal protein S17